MRLYNNMSTEDGSKVIINGWKNLVFLTQSLVDLLLYPLAWPFKNIAPIPQSNNEVNETICPMNMTEDFVNILLVDDDD